MRKKRSRLDQIERQAATHARRLTYYLKKIITLQNDAEEQILIAVRGFLNWHPMQTATKEQAALHEAGHFVAYEVEGLGAGQSEIRGTPFGRGGWSGSAAPYESRLDPWSDPTANDLIAEAKTAIAGPWAEELLGSGDLLSSISEVLEFHFLVAVAAKTLGNDRHKLLAATITEMTDFTWQYENEIRGIADRLQRRRKISRFDRTPHLRAIRAKMTGGTPIFEYLNDRTLQEKVTTLPGIDRLVNELCGV